nr:AAA family ATPase [Pseudenhygromyxa sp. WMMC2535]
MVDGYRVLRALRDSAHTQSFAALRERDERRVLVKLYEVDEAEVDLRIAHEFRAIRELEIEGLIDVLSCEQIGGRIAVVQGWCEGVSLAEFAGGRAVSVADFMTIARQLAKVLVELHRCRCIHRDIKPSNVFVAPQSMALTLAAPGISVLLEGERREVHDPWVIEGCLPYVSPEQTGRTHHAVDLRSDLYALGLVFYELLTGRRPFDASTPLEQIHAHLARRPQPALRHRPELPTVLSAITTKLLEKAPERRYQSAQGLLADLERVAAALDSGGPLEGFTLASEDQPSVLQLPHRLYGRSRELELLGRLYREACKGKARCVLVRGPTGVGKSALVDQLAEPVMGRRGYFARGRFERDQGGKPYAGVFAAFAQIADQLLTLSDERLEAWGVRLRERLGSSAAVLWELVPTLRPILGDLPPAPGVGPLESRNRLAVACAGLLAEFARIEHPLALALDDLQWADAASCELIEAILVEPQVALLVVVTLRDDEIVEGSPAERLLDTLAREGKAGGAGEKGSGERGADKRALGLAEVFDMELGPLREEEVAALVADTLAWPVDRVRPLAQIVARNTSGNPLLIGQYLTYLFDHGLLRPRARGWEWDAEAIDAAGIPEDLLGMMAAKLELLGPEDRALLAAAAVIGTRFDISVLDDLVASERLEVTLASLLRVGLLSSLRGGRYGFTHDRLRDMAYHMNGPERRAQLHSLVGESCLERSGFGEMDESFFDVVDHLDIGAGLIPLDDEAPSQARARALASLAEMGEEQRSMLAEFNALAGHNALIGAAPQVAIRYFEAGIKLVAGLDAVDTRGEGATTPPVAIDHELRFALELGRCQALGLAGDRVGAEFYFERLLQAPLDFARVGRAVASRAEIRIADSDRSGALRCGLDGLARLGVEPIEDWSTPDDFPINRLVPLLRSPTLREIGERKPIHNARLEAALEVLTALIPVSHLIDPETHVAFVTEHLQIMVEHGRFRSAPVALAYAAMIVGTAVGQRQLALEIAELARELAQHRGPGSHRQHIEPPYWVVASWVRPYAEGLGPLRESVEHALATGDLEVAGYATDMAVSMGLSAGLPLQTIARMADAAARRLRQWQAGPLEVRAEAYLEFARQVGSSEGAPGELGPFELSLAHRPSIYVIRMLRAFQRCLYGRWAEAYAELEVMEDFQRVVFGAWQMCDEVLLLGLSAAGWAGTGEFEDPEMREVLLWTTRLSQELLETAAELGPENCNPRAALLEAELSAAEGRAVEALAAYARTHREAASSGLPWLEALAFERCASYLRGLGLDELADGSLRDARERYAAWGALSKVVAIDREWPGLVDDYAKVAPTTWSGEARSALPAGDRALDLASILKASQAIAGDIQLDEVVGRVMAIAIENAGAERGALLLLGEAGLQLTALCTADSSLGGVLERPRPLAEATAEVPASLARWVERTREPAVLDDAGVDPRFVADIYIAARRVRSALCLPIIKHERLIGLLYLENNLSPGSFTSERLEILELLMAQAASALENAQLFEALRGSEVRWRSLVEGLPDVVMLVDPSGRVEFVNQDSAGARGEDAEGGRVLEDLVHREDADALHEQLGRAMRELGQTELELRARLRGGELRWYALRLAPIAVDGRVDRIIAVGTDITERREARRAKEQLEAQIRQQQRLESIGTLASGVAHEINNPVQGIMNYAELIATMKDVNDTAREFADEIGHESQRVAAIVRSLLSFSRAEGEAAAAASTDVRELIRATLLLVRTVIGKDQIQLEVQMPERALNVPCREQQIRQVLMNLVTNARDALCARWPGYHPDKRIEIVAGRVELGGRSWARISVSDHGGGVPSEVVGRIFDPFFTTKGRDQGTGLGLSVSHGIISDHGGELRLENRPGVGATFHLELPLETPLELQQAGDSHE